jgi:hypothetical protein
VIRIVGLPVSTTRVPGSGDWPATVLAAKPCTGPRTFHEKPESSSVPLAKTNAWRRTSGTTRTDGTEAAAGCAGGVDAVS